MSQAGIIEFESAFPQIPTSFVTNMGTAVPIGNVLEIFATTVAAHGIPLETTGSGNTVTVVAQYTSATVATTTTHAGFASFNSAQFVVDANGWVSVNKSGVLVELTGNSGTATPDASGNINIVTANTTIEFIGSSHTLLFDCSGGALVNLGIGSSFPSITAGGQADTGYGSAALNSIISGRHNTGIGAGSLQSLTTSSFNTMTGSQSGLDLVSGGQNCGYGYESLASLVSGNSNAAFGYETLLNCTGNSNTAIGTSAGSNYTGTESSNILLFNAGTLGESNVMRLGTAGSQTSAYAAGITGVTVAASAPVGVASTGQLSSLGFGTVNYILTSNGAGVSPTWQPNSASGDITSVLTANATPQFNLVGTVETVDFNLTNLALGSSMPSISGATNNVGMGSGALNSITSGSLNVCVGFNSGTALNSGTNNVSIGQNSLISGTTTVGSVGVGQGSLQAVTTGQYNIGVGAAALYQTNGSFNIGLGHAAGGNYTGTESYNIAIGNSGVTGESNVTRIGTPPGAGAGQSSCYVAGITGVTVAASSPVAVNSLGQLSDLGFGVLGQVLTSAGPATSPVWADGASVLAITSVTHGASPYTVLVADQFLACQTSGGVITIKLPNAPTTGRVIYIKDSNGAAATSNISVTTVGGSVTIDGQTTYTMSANYQSINVIFDGSNYEVF
jgi:hypothetical protein